MTRDYYYLKEVLLGLKEEYLKNGQNLEKLKSYIICKDKKIEDFYFWLFQNIEKETQFWIQFQPKKNFVEILQTIVGFYIENNYGLVKKDPFTKHYQIMYQKYQASLNPIFMDQFNQDIDRILTSDFVKNMVFQKKYAPCSQEIDFNLSNFSIRNSNFILSYYPYNFENIYLSKLSGTPVITRKFVQNVLSAEIPRNYFPEYHQYLIEKSEVVEKEIKVIGQILGFNRTELAIQEENSVIKDDISLGRKKTLKKSKN